MWMILIFIIILILFERIENFSLLSKVIVNPTFVNPVSIESMISQDLTNVVDSPTVIRGLFTEINHNSWISNIGSTMGSKSIEYQSQISDPKSECKMYKCKLRDYLGIYENNSDHYDALYFMDEKILNQDPNLSSTFTLPERLFQKNFFKLFPRKIRPKSALIIGGKGARSFLHIDPYDWIGTNYLLQGRKLWIFAKAPIDLFNGQKIIPEAWNTQRYQLCVGYKSDMDLFHNPLPFTLSEFSDLALRRGNEMIKKFQSYYFYEMGSDRCLIPHLLGRAYTEFKRREPDHAKVQSFGSLPMFLADKSLNLSSVVGSKQKVRSILKESLKVIIQEPGDTVFIPPSYWHQVYHLEPSISVASQFFNSWNKDKVFDHIIFNAILHSHTSETQESINQLLETNLHSAEFSQLSIKKQIQKIITLSLRIMFGKENCIHFQKELFPSSSVNL